MVNRKKKSDIVLLFYIAMYDPTTSDVSIWFDRHVVPLTYIDIWI